MGYVSAAVAKPPSGMLIYYAFFTRKTDSDTYHVLPNLLDFLGTYDAKEPTYFGSSYGISYTPNAYFQGLGYGFNWSLVSDLWILPAFGSLYPFSSALVAPHAGGCEYTEEPDGRA